MTAYQVKRTDGNQQDIMDELRKAGYIVYDTHEIGRGFPDCIASCDKGHVLIECKMPGKTLNKLEHKFFDTCPGPKAVIYYADEAVEMVTDALEE